MGYRRVRDSVIELCRVAVSIKCDVTRWDEQVALFEHAMEQFDAVDIVVSGAPDPSPRFPFSPFPFLDRLQRKRKRKTDIYCRSRMRASMKAKKSAGAISSLSTVSLRSRSYIPSR